MKFYGLYKKIILLMLLVLIPLLLSGPKILDQKLVAESASDTSVVILNYHKVDDMKISLSVAPADFEKQMAYLKEQGYTTITPDQLLDNLEKGTELPEKPILITFDDGYEDNYKNAYPVLKKYGFKATIFVITDFLDRYPNYITWAQAKELQKNGINIESHTVQHKSLTELNDDELRLELINSKKSIDEHLGKDTRYIAYPTGTYNLHIAQMVKDAGYRAAFTVKYGNVDKASNVYALERVPIFHTENTFKSFYERLHYIPIFEHLGWIKS